MVHFTSSDAGAILPGNFSFTGGTSQTFAATLTTAAAQSISVVDTSLRIAYPANYFLGPDARTLLRRIIASRAVGILPFQLDASGNVEFGVGYPVFAMGDSTQPVVGAVLLVHDASVALRVRRNVFVTQPQR